MALISRSRAFLPRLILYFITGIGSGFAIIISGKLIPWVNRMVGPEGWRTNWLILAGAVAAIAAVAHVFLRNRPEDRGLEPFGGEGKAVSPAQQAKGDVKNIYKNKTLYLLGLIYFLFGYTYVIYATFIVTTLVKERGGSETIAGNFWSWVGFLSLFSGPVFGTLSDRIGRKGGLIIVFSLQMLAYVLVAASLPPVFLYLSIGFYGIVAWSIPSIMVAAVSEYVGIDKALAAFGFITFIFGLGQITGPSLAGVLAEKTGSFSSSFFMAAALAGAAIVLAAFLRKPQKTG
jgi:predicted MFS family arabinose efflux permease